MAIAQRFLLQMHRMLKTVKSTCTNAHVDLTLKVKRMSELMNGQIHMMYQAER